ncbi:MAG: putative OsmC-like protein [bacterium]
MLVVPMNTDKVKATQLLQKAEQSCLITNSLKSATHLEISVIIADLD